MKYLLLSTTIVLALSSCNKKGCWVCTTKETTTAGAGTTVGKTTYCDKTEMEIRTLEAERSGSQTFVVNGQSVTSTAITSCGK